MKFTGHSHTPQKKCSDSYWSFGPAMNNLLLDQTNIYWTLPHARQTLGIGNIHNILTFRMASVSYPLTSLTKKKLDHVTMILTAIPWPQQDTFQWDDKDDVYFVLDQHAQLYFNRANSLKQQSTCCYTRTHYPDLESTSLCSYSLMLHALQKRSKYQFYKSLVWSDQGSNPQSIALKVSTLTIPPQMRLQFFFKLFKSPIFF